MRGWGFSSYGRYVKGLCCNLVQPCTDGGVDEIENADLHTLPSSAVILIPSPSLGQITCPIT